MSISIYHLPLVFNQQLNNMDIPTDFAKQYIPIEFIPVKSMSHMLDSGPSIPCLLNTDGSRLESGPSRDKDHSSDRERLRSAEDQIPTDQKSSTSKIDPKLMNLPSDITECHKEIMSLRRKNANECVLSFNRSRELRIEKDSLKKVVYQLRSVSNARDDMRAEIATLKSNIAALNSDNAALNSDNTALISDNASLITSQTSSPYKMKKLDALIETYNKLVEEYYKVRAQNKDLAHKAELFDKLQEAALMISQKSKISHLQLTTDL